MTNSSNSSKRITDGSKKIGNFSTHLIRHNQSVPIFLKDVVLMSNGYYNGIVDEPNLPLLQDRGWYCGINELNATIHLISWGTSIYHDYVKGNSEHTISFIRFSPENKLIELPGTVALEKNKKFSLENPNIIIAKYDVFTLDETTLKSDFIIHFNVIKLTYYTCGKLIKDEVRQIVDYKIISKKISPFSCFEIEFYLDKISDGKIINLTSRPSFHFHINKDGTCKITQI